MQSTRTDDVRPGQRWELRHPDGVGLKQFTVMEVDHEKDTAWFEELWTPAQHDSERASHMLRSGNWHLVEDV